MKQLIGAALLLAGLGCGPPPEFTLEVSSQASVVQGSTASLSVRVTRPSGSNVPVTVSLAAAPVGVSADPITIAAGDSSGVLELVADSSAPQHAFADATVQAKAGSVEHDATVGIAVRGVPGSPDLTFGSHGKVQTAFGTADENGFALALLPDGRKLLAGLSTTTQSQQALVRYGLSGQLDAFGQGGEVLTSFCDGGDLKATSIALQPDGKIVTAGYTSCTTQGTGLAVTRYNADGSLDTSFGPAHDGRYMQLIGTETFGYGIALQGDGKIVVAGESTNAGVKRIFVLRLDAAGALDGAFGTSGLTTLDFGAGASGHALALQPDGRILVAGEGGFPAHFAVARLRTDGTVDSTFGSNGTSLIPIGSTSSAQALAIQRDGKVVVAGYANDGSNSFNTAVVRLDSSGNLDPSFGTNGSVQSDLASGSGDDYGFGVAVQDDGQVVVVGSASQRNSVDMAVARYSAAGVLDDGFGTKGVLLVDFAGGDDGARSVVLDAAGTILVGGTAEGPGTGADFALLRVWQ